MIIAWSFSYGDGEQDTDKSCLCVCVCFPGTNQDKLFPEKVSGL